MPQKISLRKKVPVDRLAMDASERAQANTRILEVFSMLDFSGVSNLHIFIPIAGKGEVDTWPLINWLRREKPHITISVPRLTSDAVPRMEHVILETNSFLMPNKWMIPEPVLGKTLEARVFDLVLVPLLAIDKQGHRVGYGKGYYDRFLAACKPACRKIGLGFFEPVDSISDIEPHDVKLNALVSPAGLTLFAEDVLRDVSARS